MPPYRFLAACAATLAFGPVPAGASTFDILTTVVPGGQVVAGRDGAVATAVAFTDRQVALLGMAETFWESVLTGFSGLSASTLSLTASMTSIDGRYRTAAYAGPKTGQRVTGADPTTGAARSYLRATSGSMHFDADDFGDVSPGTQSEETFLEVALHEISHVLGYGTLFTQNGLVSAARDAYVGREAVAAFNGTNGTSVSSLLLDGAGQHWSECWVASATGQSCAPQDGSGRGGLFNDDDVLTPFVAPRTATLSPASIAAFRDLGYLTVDPFSGIVLPTAAGAAPTAPVPVPAPVPLPAGGLLLLSGLGAAAAARRRR